MASSPSGSSSPFYSRTLGVLESFLTRGGPSTIDAIDSIRSADDIGSQNTGSFGYRGDGPALYDRGRGLSMGHWAQWFGRRTAGDPRLQVQPASGYTGITGSLLFRGDSPISAFENGEIVVQGSHLQSLFYDGKLGTFNPRSLRINARTHNGNLPLPRFAGSYVLPGIAQLSVEGTVDAKAELVPQRATQRVVPSRGGVVVLHKLAGSGHGIAASRCNMRITFASMLPPLPDVLWVRGEQSVSLKRTQNLNLTARMRCKQTPQRNVPHSAALVDDLPASTRLQLATSGRRAGATQAAVPIEDLMMHEESSEEALIERANIYDLFSSTHNTRVKCSTIEAQSLFARVLPDKDGEALRETMYSHSIDSLRQVALDAPSIVTNNVGKYCRGYDPAYKSQEIAPRSDWAGLRYEERTQDAVKLTTRQVHADPHDNKAGLAAAKAGTEYIRAQNRNRGVLDSLWWGPRNPLQNLYNAALSACEATYKRLPTLHEGQFSSTITRYQSVTNLWALIRKLLGGFRFHPGEDRHHDEITVRKAPSGHFGIDEIVNDNRHRRTHEAIKPIQTSVETRFCGSKLLSEASAHEQQMQVSATTLLPAVTEAHEALVANEWERATGLYAHLFGAQAGALAQPCRPATSFRKQRQVSFSLTTPTVSQLAQALRLALANVHDAVPPYALRCNRFGVSIDALRRLQTALNSHGENALTIAANAMSAFLEPSGKDVELTHPNLTLPANLPSMTPATLKRLLATACLHDFALQVPSEATRFSYTWDARTDAYEMSALSLMQVAKSFRREILKPRNTAQPCAARAEAIRHFSRDLWSLHFVPDLAACEAEQRHLDAANGIKLAARSVLPDKVVRIDDKLVDKARKDWLMGSKSNLQVAGIEVLQLLANIAGDNDAAAKVIEHLRHDGHPEATTVAVEGLLRAAVEVAASSTKDPQREQGIANFIKSSHATLAVTKGYTQHDVLTQAASDRQFAVMEASFTALAQCDLTPMYAAEFSYRDAIAGRLTPVEEAWATCFACPDPIFGSTPASEAWRKANAAFERLGRRRRGMYARQVATGLTLDTRSAA